MANRCKKMIPWFAIQISRGKRTLRGAILVLVILGLSAGLAKAEIMYTVVPIEGGTATYSITNDTPVGSDAAYGPYFVLLSSPTVGRQSPSICTLPSQAVMASRRIRALIRALSPYFPAAGPLGRHWGFQRPFKRMGAASPLRRHQFQRALVRLGVLRWYCGNERGRQGYGQRHRRKPGGQHDCARGKLYSARVPPDTIFGATLVLSPKPPAERRPVTTGAVGAMFSSEPSRTRYEHDWQRYRLGAALLGLGNRQGYAGHIHGECHSSQHYQHGDGCWPAGAKCFGPQYL